MDLPQILACLPTDRELILSLWEQTGLPIEECPMPTDLYTLGNCARCERSIWVGPRQKDLAAKMKLEAWCYFCAGAVYGPDVSMEQLGGGVQVEGVSRW